MKVNHPVQSELSKVEAIIKALSVKKIRIVFIHAIYTISEQRPEEQKNRSYEPPHFLHH
ncbi:hypothetical protein JOC34_002795 [Virgibacillus halotolerans]|uniref:hypothetical protein n=1 Tax=Virgibacillus halotolerans TaxID=1071053 RepID=UPI0019600353|nr:hypothetical protein [Virgibacillus halotolerans]MBM7600404.1 hypothetical protein [Virgibacillus halotolerans]